MPQQNAELFLFEGFIALTDQHSRNEKADDGVRMTLVGEVLECHIPEGYRYFAMGFSMGVETLILLVGHPKDANSLAPSSD
jgi:hypothetical protein